MTARELARNWDPGPGEVVYNSDLIIRNPADLAAFGIFYNRVFLPYTTPETSRAYIAADATSVFGADLVFNDDQASEDVNLWSEENELLFHEGVIVRLPLATDLDTLDLLLGLESSSLSLFLRLPSQVTFEGQSGTTIIKQDLALHLLRTDINVPGIFVTESIGASHPAMVALEAKAAFSYLLPAVSPLTAEQILQVRRRVADTRAGFNMHLLALSRGVEERLANGASIVEMERWAKSVVASELIPDYEEFKRQLTAKGSGIPAQVLDAAGSFLEIDAGPTTPKFYGKLLQLLGIRIGSHAKELKEKLSNRHQAFQFMSKVDAASGRLRS